MIITYNLFRTIFSICINQWYKYVGQYTNVLFDTDLPEIFKDTDNTIKYLVPRNRQNRLYANSSVVILFNKLSHHLKQYLWITLWPG